MNSDLSPGSPKLDRTIVVLFGVLTITLALLFVIAGMTWAVRNELVGGPTPTPTATQKPTIPPTPDFRATRFIQDALTKEAYEAVVGPVTPDATPTESVNVALLPVIGAPGEAPTPTLPPTSTPTPTPAPTATPTDVDIHLPVVSISDQTPTAAAPISALETPVFTPTPTATASPTPSPTFTPTFTPEPVITPTPIIPTPVSPAPTATPVLRVPELRARVTREGGATVRVGPSTVYSDTGVIDNGVEIQLRGRTASGEWVYGCCIAGDEELFWVRQVDAPPTENDLGDIVPTGEPTDDVRWLAVQPLNPTLTPLPSPTAIPVTDYPLFRRDPSNQARVEQLPRPPLALSPGWPYVPGGNFLSPVIVGGNHVLATSTDSHMYSVAREGGNQSWREQLLSTANQAFAIVGDFIYLVDNNGVLYSSALQSGELRWQVELNVIPVSGINIADEYLFLSAQRDGAHLLMMREQEDGEFVGEFNALTSLLQYPAVGDQLVYAAGEEVWALDIFDELAEIWNYEDFGNATAPPLYIRPGVRAAAELYVADDSNRIICLDANTGRQLWVYESGEQVTGMVADEERLFLSGGNFIKAISRRDHENLWRELTDGLVLGGPIIGDDEVMIITENGDISYRDTEDGGRVFAINANVRLVSPGAVSGGRLFVAGQNGMYGFQGGGQ